MQGAKESKARLAVSTERMDGCGKLKDNSCHTEALGRLRVGGNIVNINGFRSPDLAGAKRLAVNSRVGLAGAYAIGIDAVGEESEEGEARLLMGHVDGVGVGK